MAESKSKKGSFGSDLCTLLESGKGADVTLVVGDSHLPAHSVILAARSPVFDAMLRNNMLEATSRLIKITDVQEAVLQQMLLFIYTDTVPELERFAAQLLAVADKYDLPLLKRRCASRMALDLSVENAAATALVATLHRCPELRSAAVEFIARHPEVITGSDWAQLLRENAEAAADISSLVAAALPRPPSTETSGYSNMPDRIKQKMMARLMEAARSGSAREVWALLLAGVAKDARDGRANTALHLAADGGHAITVKHLLDAGLDANSVNSNRRTPLHLAAQRGNTDIIWMLVRASARVDAQDAMGQTALHVAASVNTAVKDDRVHVVNTLLLAGATKDITDLKKQKPEHLATVSTKTAFNTFNTVSSPYIDL
ncbi:uncharacterized protein LOC126439757 [Schistocerca serialis cubense]|uniref:uncharacterized protein LOC126439757 n=1 Tax=Schistocerca serialis cubense TaxID=2023355 RepID=UPI00214F41B1|nr:uncharacterized protein LOC126439757 [Schistocerca serialis cubense]